MIFLLQSRYWLSLRKPTLLEKFRACLQISKKKKNDVQIAFGKQSLKIQSKSLKYTCGRVPYCVKLLACTLERDKLFNRYFSGILLALRRSFSGLLSKAAQNCCSSKKVLDDRLQPGLVSETMAKSKSEILTGHFLRHSFFFPYV